MKATAPAREAHGGIPAPRGRGQWNQIRSGNPAANPPSFLPHRPFAPGALLFPDARTPPLVTSHVTPACPPELLSRDPLQRAGFLQ